MMQYTVFQSEASLVPAPHLRLCSLRRTCEGEKGGVAHAVHIVRG